MARNDGLGDFLLGMTVIGIPLLYFSISPIVDSKKYARKQTEITSNFAHYHAVNSVDTINFDGTPIDVKTARKDSATAIKQMRKAIRKFHKSDCFDYFNDPPKRIVSYDPTDTAKTNPHYSWTKWHLNIDKAMNDSAFAASYNKYYKSIQQLEIARRQSNQK
ncbi:MAG: hypothetical protein IKN73_03345 [Alphaproteobacteria bacterium]|nr:hypothetical protein [Alphaproteobacteria bacterium]